jgi:hypothetical protein
VIKEDILKTTFWCWDGLHDFMVIPFGLSNAPANFQDLMNHILKDLLGVGVVLYIDDILIYTTMEEIHNLLVKEVLKTLAENELVISPEKCILSSEGPQFLGYVINADGPEMGKDKIEVIKEWEP